MSNNFSTLVFQLLCIYKNIRYVDFSVPCMVLESKPNAIKKKKGKPPVWFAPKPRASNKIFPHQSKKIP